jgi:pimeloyl-ACP methyl ester carboxylesterase
LTELYPPIEPYDQGLLDVGDGNLVYWETCGNPDGKPAVMVHGGPGQGCAPNMRRMFDPSRYRAVLFDQRGCWRIRPHASDPSAPVAPDDYVLAFVRICAHYYSHAGFLEDGAVIRDAGRLAGIPGVLIHGRLDLSCPATTAWELARAWPGADLLIDDHSGHRGSDVKRAWMLETLARFARR